MSQPQVGRFAATAVGSFPGTDIWETSRIVSGELGDLPILAELPARGPGGDMIGRTLAMLAGVSPEFAAETTPTGWRLSGQVSSDLPRVMRQAKSWLTEDLDAAGEVWHDYAGAFKIQIAGPWTLAAAVELGSGARLISDRGAARDLAGALGDAIGGYLRRVRASLPEAQFIVQLDEPALPAVLEGRLPTQSGFGAHAAIELPAARTSLELVVGAIKSADAAPAVHCCGSNPPIELLSDSGAQFVSIDLGLARHFAVDDQLGSHLENGRCLIAGLPTDLTRDRSVKRTVAPLLSLLERLGMDFAAIGDQLVLSPPCGLAGSNAADVRRVLADLRMAGNALRDESVGDARSEESR